MSSGTSTNPVRQSINWLSNHPGTRLIIAAAITYAVYMTIGSHLHDAVPFFWALRNVGSLSALFINFWLLPLLVVFGVVYVGAVRIRKNMPRRTSPELGWWLVLRSAYEETALWLLGTFWTVVVFSVPSAFEWLFGWLSHVVNFMTFWMMSSHPGSHSWMIGAAAILAAIPFFGTPAFGQPNRFGGWWINVILYAVMMSSGILAAVIIRLGMHVLIVITRRAMDARQTPAPAPAPTP